MISEDRLTILLPKELKIKLQEKAKEKAIPVSTLIRLIISEWINKNEKQNKKGG
ncbi:hypothetical protein J7M02_06855 [Candidatus Aerophobetes bacterium]|nr:hypothetical protein [Candidatus Aerophobetes bacterium]